MEYYNGKLCISMKELIKEGIMSEANYKRLASAGQFQLARNGKGLGCYALVVVDTLPDRFRMKVNKTYPDGRQIVLDGWVRSNYEVDQNAVVYFNDRSQTGVEMTEARKTRMCGERLGVELLQSSCMKTA